MGAVAALLLPSSLFAQVRDTCFTPTSSADDSLALRHAPVFSFLESERYFPVLPFFTAFDGRNNNNDTTGLTDFADPSEIMPMTRQHEHGRSVEPRPSLDSLNATYLGDSLRFTRSAVLYAVREARERERSDFWNTLRTDAERKAGLFGVSLLQGAATPVDALFDEVDAATRDTLRLTVIEYHLYYLREGGIQSRVEDFEFVILVVPTDTRTLYPFRVTIGSTPSGRALNNVAIELPRDSSGEWIPPPPPRILVELGGHSNAPDLGTTNVYQHGIDVNWHDQNAWGIRDNVLGEGRDRYVPGMTNMAGARRILNPPRTDTPRTATVYSLVPLHLVHCLSHADRDSIAALVSELQEHIAYSDSIRALVSELQEHIVWTWEHQGFDELSDSARDVAIDSMRKYWSVKRDGRGRVRPDSFHVDGQWRPVMPHRWHRPPMDELGGIPLDVALNRRLVYRERLDRLCFTVLCWSRWPGFAIGAAPTARGAQADVGLESRVGLRVWDYGGTLVQLEVGLAASWESSPTTSGSLGLGTYYHVNRPLTPYWRLSHYFPYGARRRVSGSQQTESTTRTALPHAIDGTFVAAGLSWLVFYLPRSHVRVEAGVRARIGSERANLTLGEARWEAGFAWVP